MSSSDSESDSVSSSSSTSSEHTKRKPNGANKLPSSPKNKLNFETSSESEKEDRKENVNTNGRRSYTEEHELKLSVSPPAKYKTTPNGDRSRSCSVEDAKKKTRSTPIADRITRPIRRRSHSRSPNNRRRDDRRRSPPRRRSPFRRRSPPRRNRSPPYRERSQERKNRRSRRSSSRRRSRSVEVKKERRSSSRSSSPKLWGKKNDDRSKSRSASRSPHPKRQRSSSGERRRRSTGQDRRERSRSGSRVRIRRHSPPRRHERGRIVDSEEPEDKKQREDQRWASRRNDRLDVMENGVSNVWASSPTQREIESVYALYEEVEEMQLGEEEKGEAMKADRKKEKKTEQKKRTATLMKGDVSASSASDDEEEDMKKKKKAKKEKKEKKMKKEKKHKKDKKMKKEKKMKEVDNSDEDEWVEVTDKMREREAEREAREEEEMAGPAIPEHLLARNQQGGFALGQKTNYGKDMLKGEAQAMAAYAARGERIPRRGEIGLSSSEISEFEKVGYVMSGTRHKAMEATRLRKENQVLTAEEKRLLSGFTHEERKKKEDTVLSQFRSLIESKRQNE